MKNKFIALLLLLVVIAFMFSLAACRSKTEDNTTATTYSTTTFVTEGVITTTFEESSAEIVPSLHSVPNSVFTPSYTQDNNETVILTNPVVNSGDDTPVLNTEDSAEKPQVTKSEFIQMTEPTLPFKEEIELPFVPIQ